MSLLRNLPPLQALATVLMLLLIPARSLEAQDIGSIGIYFDEMGTACSGVIEAGVPGTVYVIAKAGGFSPDGLAGAEFRFAGIPDSWSVFPVANPNILSLGDPFGEGVTTVFPCLLPANSSLILYTVLVLATATEADLDFEILMRDPPINPRFQCPLMLLCDRLSYPSVCVQGIPCHVNPSSPRICALAVEDETWSAVKRLYR